jgi:hypothetical protein
MISNRFDVGIVYLLKVEIIRIIFKKLFIRNNISFFQDFCPDFLASFSFWLSTFFFEFALFFPFFSKQKLPSEKFETKKTCWFGEGGVNPTI